MLLKLTIIMLLAKSLVFWSNSARGQDADTDYDPLLLFPDNNLDPELNLFWALPYVGVNNAEVWIIAGSVEDTTTEEGKQSRLLMVDAQFTEDKLSRIIFYEKARASSQN